MPTMNELYEDEVDADDDEQASPSTQINSANSSFVDQPHFRSVQIVQADCSAKTFYVPVGLKEALPISFLFPAGHLTGWQAHLPKDVTVVCQFVQEGNIMYAVVPPADLQDANLVADASIFVMPFQPHAAQLSPNSLLVTNSATPVTQPGVPAVTKAPSVPTVATSTATGPATSQVPHPPMDTNQPQPGFRTLADDQDWPANSTMGSTLHACAQDFQAGLQDPKILAKPSLADQLAQFRGYHVPLLSKTTFAVPTSGVPTVPWTTPPTVLPPTTAVTVVPPVSQPITMGMSVASTSVTYSSGFPINGLIPPASVAPTPFVPTSIFIPPVTTASMPSLVQSTTSGVQNALPFLPSSTLGLPGNLSVADKVSVVQQFQANQQASARAVDDTVAQFLQDLCPSIPDDPEAEQLYDTNQTEESKLLLQLFPRPSNVDVGQIPELNRYLKEAYLSSSHNAPQDDLYRDIGQHLMQVLYGVVPVLLGGRQQHMTDAEFADWSKELELALFALKGQNIALDAVAKLRSCHLYHKFAHKSPWKKIGMLRSRKFGAFLGPADPADALEQLQKAAEDYKKMKQAISGRGGWQQSRKRAAPRPPPMHMGPAPYFDNQGAFYPYGAFPKRGCGGFPRGGSPGFYRGSAPTFRGGLNRRFPRPQHQQQPYQPNQQGGGRNRFQPSNR